MKTIPFITFFFSLAFICQSQHSTDFFGKPQTSFDIKDLTRSNYQKSFDLVAHDEPVVDTIINKAAILAMNLQFYEDLMGNIKVDQIEELKLLIDTLKIIKSQLIVNKPNASDEEKYALYDKIKDAEKRFEKIVLDFKESLTAKDLSAEVTPAIDAFQSRLAPTAEVQGKYNVGKVVGLVGEVYTGNALNGELNRAAIYNPAASTFGTNFSANFTKCLPNSKLYGSLSLLSSLAHKSLFRQDTTSLNFYQSQNSLRLDLGYKDAFTFYGGINIINVFDNIDLLNKELNPQNKDSIDAQNQSFWNIGFRGVYSIGKGAGSKLALDVNALRLREEQQEILDAKNDRFLTIVQFSLLKTIL